ncbi:pyruvate, phosphate dikinase [Enterococcus faecalis]|nr:pyruvate, phosphate dikinase [Enterococcus faecalis]EKG8795447.1 pyruvate, phosphate dikinase [Enterococcus faecalis]EKZ0223478.1 pyruvate, phosphate dikinase [Enterococcus faecalis]HDT8139837.1 pyruvate, phosphate dikinase [Enterococcus faecalis]HDT8147754.1 pyruvate, phosphate dikinase [Enterococcus faecalis]
MKKFVYSFNETHNEGKETLGGKGANLAEMTRLGLPIPQGFTITTRCCMDYLADATFFEEHLQSEILKAVKNLETETGKSFTADNEILLVSVRSGAAFSMPGMMDTILNLGLNDQRVKKFATLTSPGFAFDCYRRLIQMFGDVVYHIPKELFDQQKERLEQELNKKITAFQEADHFALIVRYQEVFEQHQVVFPQDPVAQLFEAIKAVFDSWNNQRAVVYRNLHHIAHDLGTAVNIQEMVFGNRGLDSGTGVVFTRNPVTGENQLFGEFLLNAQGEDVVAGIRTPEPIRRLRLTMPKVYQDFRHYAELLEYHYRDMQDIEFTIENEKLYILQTRNGKRTAAATVKIALDLAKENRITKQEALLRVTPDTIDQLIHPVFDQEKRQHMERLAMGLPASPGAASGQIVFTAEKAKELTNLGKKVILVRQETSPEDIEGMVVSEAIVTSRGGMTSHAAVVARGMGTCCVTGCESLTVNEETKQLHCGPQVILEGTIISVDGSTGEIYLGEIPTISADNNDDLQELLSWADAYADLTVRANAETTQDLETAIRFGAAGIGLARTEHMFFGEERVLEMRRLILAESEKEATYALEQLLHFQQEDFYQMLKVVQDKPMVVRLLDPPMHEFLPHEKNDIQLLAKQLQRFPVTIAKQIERLQETNPMLGHRGCRLGVTQPQIYKMQVTALFTSAIRLVKEGITVYPEVMIPLIAEKEELLYLKRILKETIDGLFEEHKMTPFPYEIGTMIELPRACLIADQLAEEADFFSFGTNDLTQMTYGFSRDDIGKFINTYREKKIITQDPFQSLDQTGVGQLIQLAVEKARRTKPNMSIGVCGEVGGDPQSITFFQTLGLNYISCSPYRVPIAKLAAAQAKILTEPAVTEEQMVLL